MPWNDNSNGGGGGGGPWGPGGGSGGGSGGNSSGGSGPRNPWGTGGNQPPRRPGNSGESGNLDDLAKRVEDRLKNVLGGGGGGGGLPRGGGGGGEPIQFDKRTLGAIALVAVLGWFATGIYVVDAGEEAVIQRFGKYVDTQGQGLHVHMPSPIETRQIVDVQTARSLTVGGGAGAGPNDGLMLTADENIVDVGFQVWWRIENSRDYLFQVAHGQDGRSSAEETVRAVAEAAMREVAGRSQREQVLSTGRATVETQTRDLIQRTLNEYKAGIRITQVNLTKAEPPAAVNDAFREVAAASQEAETKINQARSYRNAVVPQAQGEAARFNQLYQEYRLAPDVTRQRLYLETMEKVYERANKVLLDPGRTGNAPMVVLPPELLKGAATNAAPAQPAAQNNNAQGVVR
ncbi:modulator of FtsH protease HflK [Candidatus Phycosocius bacilliformis]|uniref:Protein HflK n=1 Tax=Candidatus Phycosocius bacilliformis TaxID=1445552 RepID=A0A2P2E644_9PROT|nr:FtsH protease activity modulator HflK [Candidatus Phycosocius bacilliformis]GBF56531.1 modulator of FtsH protease HflK [Candidatus Phycosocius bacilliformis]